MSTNADPVSASTCCRTSAVISMRNDSRSPVFHSAKICADLRGRGTQPLAQQVVRLGDELHVGVLDAVVHHLDEVAGAVRADVRAARHAVDLGRDLLEDRAERLVGLRGAAGHDRRAEQRALLAARDAGADEVQALLAQRGLAADRVREVRVAGVDDDVALLEERHELVDDRVRGAAGLDHDDDLARAARATRRSPRPTPTARTCPRRRGPPPATRSWRTSGCGWRPCSRCARSCGRGCGPSPPAR